MINKTINSVLESFLPDKSNVLKALHQLQDLNNQNYLTQEALECTAKYFKLTKAQIFGIVSYYSMFSLKPRGKYLLRLCKSPVCQMLGSQNIISYIEKKWNIFLNKPSQDRLFYLELVECLGGCDKAPSMLVNKEFFSGLDKKKIDEILLNKINNS